MMVIMIVLSSQSLDDPSHLLTITTHDDDLPESSMSSLLRQGPLLLRPLFLDDGALSHNVVASH